MAFPQLSFPYLASSPPALSVPDPGVGLIAARLPGHAAAAACAASGGGLGGGGGGGSGSNAGPNSQVAAAAAAASLLGLYSTTYGSLGYAAAFLPYPAADVAAVYAQLGAQYELKEFAGMSSHQAFGPHPALHPLSPHYYSPYGGAQGPPAAGDPGGRLGSKAATRESTGMLKAWLNEHRKNPYPTKGEKIMLALVTKMTLTQVSTWFANARRRLKKESRGAAGGGGAAAGASGGDAGSWAGAAACAGAGSSRARGGGAGSDSDEELDPRGAEEEAEEEGRRCCGRVAPASPGDSAEVDVIDDDRDDVGDDDEVADADRDEVRGDALRSEPRGAAEEAADGGGGAGGGGPADLSEQRGQLTDTRERRSSHEDTMLPLPSPLPVTAPPALNLPSVAAPNPPAGVTAATTSSQNSSSKPKIWSLAETATRPDHHPRMQQHHHHQHQQQHSHQQLPEHSLAFRFRARLQMDQQMHHPLSCHTGGGSATM